MEAQLQCTARTDVDFKLAGSGRPNVKKFISEIGDFAPFEKLTTLEIMGDTQKCGVNTSDWAALYGRLPSLKHLTVDAEGLPLKKLRPLIAMAPPSGNSAPVAVGPFLEQLALVNVHLTVYRGLVQTLIDLIERRNERGARLKTLRISIEDELDDPIGAFGRLHELVDELFVEDYLPPEGDSSDIDHTTVDYS
jgi:hypothetical protein